MSREFTKFVSPKFFTLKYFVHDALGHDYYLNEGLSFAFVG